MSMACYKSCDIRELGGQRHHRVRKVIAACARLQSHVTCEHNRVRAFALRLGNCATYRLNGMLKINSNRKLPWKPKRHPRSCDSNNCDLDALDVPNDKWFNLRKRMLRIGG